MSDTKVALDPLGNMIKISDNTDVVGDHPYKHSVHPNHVLATIERPDRIVGTSNSKYYDIRTVYLLDLTHPHVSPRLNDPKKNLAVAVVEIDGEKQGHVVTCYTSPPDKLPRSVNTDDVRYSASDRV